MPTGKVKWFNNAKGFGFILPEGGGEDLFAHYSAIEMDGYKTLKAGQTVSYELDSTDKGGHAKKISVIQSEDQSAASEPAKRSIEPATADEEYLEASSA